jgi:hypothetical protein
VDRSGASGAPLLIRGRREAGDADRFIGVAEVLGAIGLILPGVLGIAQGLTPLAAAGLVVIMAGATILTGGAAALIPLTVGLLLAFVGYGRTRRASRKNIARSVHAAASRST